MKDNFYENDFFNFLSFSSLNETAFRGESLFPKKLYLDTVKIRRKECICTNKMISKDLSSC